MFIKKCNISGETVSYTYNELNIKEQVTNANKKFIKIFIIMPKSVRIIFYTIYNKYCKKGKIMKKPRTNVGYKLTEEKSFVEAYISIFLKQLAVQTDHKVERYFVDMKNT